MLGRPPARNPALKPQEAAHKPLHPTQSKCNTVKYQKLEFYSNDWLLMLMIMAAARGKIQRQVLHAPETLPFQQAMDRVQGKFSQSTEMLISTFSLRFLIIVCYTPKPSLRFRITGLLHPETLLKVPNYSIFYRETLF